MRSSILVILWGILLGAAGPSAGAEPVIREYPDRIVAEYDGSGDPKAASPAGHPSEKEKEAVPEIPVRVDEQTQIRVRNRAEERMERNRLRNEYNEQELERKRKEQEEAW